MCAGVSKRIAAVVFIGMLCLVFLKSGSYMEIRRLAELLRQDAEASESEDVLTMDRLETEFSSGLWKQRMLLELNGWMGKRLHMQGFYSGMGIYVTDDNYIVSASDSTSTDYEYEELLSLKHFLDENGIGLLYVNEPTKYVDDDFFREEFGVETYSNRNMDRFLMRIREAGVPAIDLRDNIRKEGLNVRALFYRTDHHWTTRAGLWAVRIIAEGLNTYCGYSVDTSVYDESNYNFTEWNACWLGEQGRKLSQAYVGLDDYTEIKPNFTTSYTFFGSEGAYEGTFDRFINEEVYNPENSVYENKSWHYSYNQISCINHNAASGKVLLLGDSYEQVTEPFLSLGVREIDALILRNYDDSFHLRDYILEKGYDTVLICYAQFMLGAHDNEASANYRMFCFE